MISNVALAPGRSITVAAACTITLDKGEIFSSGSSGPAVVARLIVEGEGAEVALTQPPLSGDHGVAIVEGDD
jgi:hypothetical protein